VTTTTDESVVSVHARVHPPPSPFFRLGCLSRQECDNGDRPLFH